MNENSVFIFIRILNAILGITCVLHYVNRIIVLFFFNQSNSFDFLLLRQNIKSLSAMSNNYQTACSMKINMIKIMLQNNLRLQT